MSARPRPMISPTRSRRSTAVSATAPFALGDRFSAVDVLLGDIGAWARGGRFRIESERVAAYLDRVLSRPARARAQANGGAFR